LNGRVVQRLCTINHRTTKDHVRATIERFEQLGRRVANQFQKL
jgi:hypothetical protein